MSSDQTQFLPNANDAPMDRQNQAVNEFWSILFTLSVIFTVCFLTFFCLRRKRQMKQLQKSCLPMHRPMAQQSSITVNGESRAVFVIDERRNLVANSSSPNNSPVPEIHITLPDEDESSGQTKPGRVVVLHITDSGSVGMTPLSTESLPKYEKEDSGRFRSVDLERIGGLRENPSPAPAPAGAAAAAAAGRWS